MITILVVDDEASVRQGLRMRLGLEPDLQIVGEATDGLEAIKLAQLLQPDVVVLDVEMPHMDGIATARALHIAAPRVAIVILSLYGDPVTRMQADAAGVVAFVAKQGDVEELIAAIHAAAGPG